jgi:hypothetical protein
MCNYKFFEQKDGRQHAIVLLARENDMPTNLNQHKPSLSENEILAVISGTSIWPELKPLQRELPPARDFPVQALGKILQEAITSLAKIVGIPTAIAAQSVLATTTLSTQPLANILIDGRSIPLSLYFLTMAASGDRKTSADTEALKEIRNYEVELDCKYQKDLHNYLDEKSCYEAAKSECLSGKNKGYQLKKQALVDLGAPPNPPINTTILCQEPTLEGLFKSFQKGQPSQGIFSSEAGRLLGGHAMNRENLLKTAAGLSEFWDGATISRVRAGDGCTTLRNRRLTMHLQVQPKIGQKFLSDPQLIEQGLLSRLLITYPESLAGNRKYKEIDLTEDAALKIYHEKIRQILCKPLQTSSDCPNELQPRELFLTREAKSKWVNFYNEVEIKLGSDGEYAQIRSFAAKSPEHCLRLAGILAVFENPDCKCIDLNYIESAIELVSFYLYEALRLFAVGVTDENLVQAQKLLDWLNATDKEIVSLVEIYRYGPTFVRTAKKARYLMNILIQHGYALRIPDGWEFDNQLRKEAFKVRPINSPAIFANHANSSKKTEEDIRSISNVSSHLLGNPDKENNNKRSSNESNTYR